MMGRYLAQVVVILIGIHTLIGGDLRKQWLIRR